MPVSVPFLGHPSAGAVPKKGRSAKRDSTTEFTRPAPGTLTAQLQPEGQPLHGSARPYPPDSVVDSTIVRDGLLYAILGTPLIRGCIQEGAVGQR